ncbi:hypothetical protein ACWZJV_06300 [Nocardioides sp. WG-D5]|uniref:hypothetical protein n=1 Tax=Nocardioides luteus TaxID=1844 RepID=UPI0002028EB1|nr:hypothetical protein [Nocardioides luteus]EGD40346.1 serine/arginine repetitive matrix protein 2 [Nocardioidaceae bacterium Broad-1]MBG6095346.1 type II secretory pathway pseudopilin PulG [Nocardioides luteus]
MSLRTMQVIAASLIAILGTLLGSGATYVIQRSTARQQQLLARTEKLRQERVDACASYASALLELRTSRMDRYHAVAADREDREHARRRSYEVRAIAQGARMRVRLLIPDPTLIALADEAIEAALAIKPQEPHKDFLERIEASQEAVDRFIDACRESVALE